MELSNFLSKFADQFDDADHEEIQADTAFHNLDEWGKSDCDGCHCHGENAV